ncbi:T34 [Tupaiid betaherpesvirus 1]|uniref:T34 n=1 Tax=Tupaiid herpesvirus 1 (strain 1) TaxID=10397 RepID=Q91TQ8_TUHV1|nr:T34 [Tupaiid betaherpesvirus 1]AAK57079.1 T34 [Tupaiid betaherpesvirus 1]
MNPAGTADETVTSTSQAEAPPPPRLDESAAGDDLDAFWQPIADRYKQIARAEDKKRALEDLLPDSVRAKAATRSYLFCTSLDSKRINDTILQLRRGTEAVDVDRLAAEVKSVKCRLRKKPPPETGDEHHALLQTVRRFCIAFNRLTCLAKMKHYCDHDSELVAYLRAQLHQRCGDNSQGLGERIRRCLQLIDRERHGDLCTVLAGIAHQTPHMWSRSIRLLGKLKVFFQNAFLRLLSDLHLDPILLFEPPFQASAHRLTLQVCRLKPEAFRLNWTVRPHQRRRRPGARQDVVVGTAAATAGGGSPHSGPGGDGGATFFAPEDSVSVIHVETPAEEPTVALLYEAADTADSAESFQSAGAVSAASADAGQTGPASALARLEEDPDDAEPSAEPSAEPWTSSISTTYLSERLA